MKKVMFLILAGSLVLGSCKKEGCTDAAATNYDDKAKDNDGSCVYPAIVVPADTEAPTVVITMSSEFTVIAGESLDITATISDNTAATSWEFSYKGESGVVYGLTVANISGGLIQDVAASTVIAATAAAGSYILTIAATDAAGNASTAATLGFTIDAAAPTDTEKPEITEPNVTFPSGGTMSSGTGGTDGVKVSLVVSDYVELSWVKAYLYDTDNSVAIDSLVETGITGQSWSKTDHKFTYPRSEAQSQKGAIKIVAQDKAGNESTVTGSKVLVFGL
jgi:hypothetical protein